MIQAPHIPQTAGALGVRLAAAGFLAASLGLLLTAASLEANPTGAGTHTQLGLPACQWHSDRGRACPTCGMTTAFALAAQGRLLAAAHAQPAGALTAIALAMAAWLAGYALLTGRAVTAFLTPLRRPATLIVAVSIVLAAWAYKLLTA